MLSSLEANSQLVFVGSELLVEMWSLQRIAQPMQRMFTSALRSNYFRSRRSQKMIHPQTEKQGVSRKQFS
jgi:hypothetical protein